MRFKLHKLTLMLSVALAACATLSLNAVLSEEQVSNLTGSRFRDAVREHGLEHLLSGKGIKFDKSRIIAHLRNQPSGVVVAPAATPFEQTGAQLTPQEHKQLEGEVAVVENQNDLGRIALLGAGGAGALVAVTAAMKYAFGGKDDPVSANPLVAVKRFWKYLQESGVSLRDFVVKVAAALNIVDKNAEKIIEIPDENARQNALLTLAAARAGKAAMFTALATAAGFGGMALYQRGLLSAFADYAKSLLPFGSKGEEVVQTTGEEAIAGAVKEANEKTQDTGFFGRMKQYVGWKTVLAAAAATVGAALIIYDIQNGSHGLNAISTYLSGMLKPISNKLGDAYNRVSGWWRGPAAVAAVKPTLEGGEIPSGRVTGSDVMSALAAPFKGIKGFVQEYHSESELNRQRRAAAAAAAAAAQKPGMVGRLREWWRPTPAPAAVAGRAFELPEAEFGAMPSGTPGGASITGTLAAPFKGAYNWIQEKHPESELNRARRAEAAASAATAASAKQGWYDYLSGLAGGAAHTVGSAATSVGSSIAGTARSAATSLGVSALASKLFGSSAEDKEKAAREAAEAEKQKAMEAAVLLSPSY